MNVCTFGYSYVHWEWDRWEREIDWMALNGVNMPLAFNGYIKDFFLIHRQEYLFYQVYRELGLSEEGILRHFTGVHFDVQIPVSSYFEPWNRMGNIKQWGGPLTLSFLQHELELNKRVFP